MLDLNPGKKLPTYSTREHVYNVLKENIITLKLEPGRNITEKEMSESLQVSRTPVREAFVKLAQDGLLEIYPQRASFVSLIDLYLVEEARFVRENLERAVVRVACETLSTESIFKLEQNLLMQKHCIGEKNFKTLYSLDEEFHYIIAAGSGKELIWNIIQQMNAHLNRLRMLSLSANYNWELVFEQHRQLLEAIKSKDPDLAEKVMENHLKKLILEQEDLKNEYKSYFK